MATETDKGAAGNAGAAEEGKRPAPRPVAKYTRPQLEGSARAALGHSRHAVRGALAGDNRQHFTIEQARQLTDEWLTKPVRKTASR